MKAETKATLTERINARATERAERQKASRIRRATHPRLRKLSLQLHGSDVDAWMRIAADNGESLTDLMERTMNALRKDT